MKTAIRDLTPERARGAFEVERESLSTAFSEEQINECARGESAVKYLVLCEDEAVRGICSFTVAAGECEVINLAVAKGSRRKGYGGALLGAVLSAARGNGAEKAFLEVAEGNSAAVSLYVKNGFEPVGRRRNFYRGEDAVIMQKTL
ncbi:MAG: GNAT family N-acetyltransferase [Clostridia bacterium]|nr:GNAT family N-acetyltransferase [Clostridia bacterium]